MVASKSNLTSVVVVCAAKGFIKASNQNVQIQTKPCFMSRETYQELGLAPMMGIVVQVRPTKPDIASGEMFKELRTGVTEASVGNWAALPIIVVCYSTIIV